MDVFVVRAGNPLALHAAFLRDGSTCIVLLAPDGNTTERSRLTSFPHFRRVYLAHDAELEPHIRAGLENAGFSL